MTYSQQDGARDTQVERAAIFVDYENLYRTLSSSAGDASPVDLISEMIESLRRSLLEDRRTQTTVTRAYADFATLDVGGERLQRALYLQDVETHFVARDQEEDAVELQLCVDAMDLMHHRSDVTTFILLTGRRIYLPLVRMFKRYGRHVLVVGLDEPAGLDQVPQLSGDWFLPASDLVSSPIRPRVPSTEPPRRAVRSSNRKEIEEPILIQTLEIIDEYFGQYEEVYLTPLLRKLSELLDERRYDPKNLISDLEDHEAVRLEKRQGFPHDYTVLILEELHPSVERVLAGARIGGTYFHEDARDGESDVPSGARFRRNGEAGYDGEAYDDESYDDNAYDDRAHNDRAHDDRAYADDAYDDNAFDDDEFDDDAYDDNAFDDDEFDVGENAHKEYTDSEYAGNAYSEDYDDDLADSEDVEESDPSDAAA